MVRTHTEQCRGSVGLTIVFIALIEGVCRRHDGPAADSSLTTYLYLQYMYVTEQLTQDERDALPPENQLFIELYSTVLLRSRKSLCKQRKLIRDGQTTVEAARGNIPRLDLKIAAAKQKNVLKKDPRMTGGR